MKTVWWYLGTGLVCFGCGAVMPGTWLLRQPNGFEAAQLAGVVLLVAAAYLSLLHGRVAAWLALAGVAAVAGFMAHAALAVGRERPVALVPVALALGASAAAASMAVRVLQGFRQEPAGGGWRLVWPALLVLVVLGYFWPWRGRRDPSRYLVPQGYVGWVVIEYGVRGAAPLPIRDGALEIAIPSSGRLQTSSEQESGFALDDWELVNAAGVRRPMDGPDTPGGRIWRWSAGTSEEPGKPDRHTEQFFAGTEAQFNALGEKTYPEGQ